MGEIVGAGLVAHVPTIMLPEDIRKELNDGKEISLVPGLKRMRTEVLDRLRPDTIIVFDTHWETTFEHIITSAERRTGHFTSSELPRGMAGIPYDIPGDPELAAALEKKAAGRDDTWILACDDPYLPIYYGTVNIWSHLNGGERWASHRHQPVRADRGLPAARAAAGRGHRGVGPPGRAAGVGRDDAPLLHVPRAAAARVERSVEHHLARGARGRRAHPRAVPRRRSRTVIEEMPEYKKQGPEGKFGHYLIMAGALGGAACTAPGEQFSDYEAAVGTGQVHVWFERPAGGWGG